MAHASNPFWADCCRDAQRVQRELIKAEQSARSDLQKAAGRARVALACGDKRETFLALRDIDPPCAFLFDYNQP